MDPEALQKEAEKKVAENPDKVLANIKKISLISKLYFALLLLIGVAGVLFGFSILLHSGTVAAWVITIFGAMTFAIGRGILYRPIKIEGYKLTENEATKNFFELIRDLEKKTNTKIHEVYIDESRGAGVLQRPRFGFFGGYQNALILGLPFLFYVSTDQLKAILAHEFGHISNNDGRDNSVGRSTRDSWIRVIQSMSTTWRAGYTAPLVLWYMKQAWPRLNAYAFAFNRFTEARADTFAENYAHPESWVAGLLRVHILEHCWDEYGNAFVMDKQLMSNPNPTLHDDFRKMVKKPASEATLKYWINLATFRPEDPADTHPSLEKRLKAHGSEMSPTFLFSVANKPLPDVAADFVLGSDQDVVIKSIDDIAKTRINGIQQKTQKAAEEAETVKSNFEEDLKQQDLKTVYSAINTTLSLEGATQTKPYVEKLVEKKPDDVFGQYVLGKILLMEGDERGEAIYKKLLSERKANFNDIYIDLYRYYSKIGNRDKVNNLQNAMRGGVWV